MIRRQVFPTAILALTLCVVHPGMAAIDHSSVCDRAAAGAAAETGVPVDLLLAITRVETGRGGAEPWPWTINAGGQGTFYDTKDDAVSAATNHLAAGTASFDVGCFQLNTRWHGENFADLSAMFDPSQNAAYAARFLMQLYEDSGDWPAAVSAYHSRTPDLAEAYLKKVKAVLDGPALPDPAAPPPPDRENHFPLLQAGGQGSTGSLVPVQMARGRLIGGGW